MVSLAYTKHRKHFVLPGVEILQVCGFSGNFVTQKNTSRASPFCQCIVCKLHLCFPEPTHFTHVFQIMPAPQPPAGRSSVPTS